MFRLIKNNTPGPYTFIFKGTKEVPKRLLNDKKKTIGIRVIEHPIACALLAELGEPLMSCSLILPGDEYTQADPDDILDRLDKHVDLIIHLFCLQRSTYFGAWLGLFCTRDRHLCQLCLLVADY